MAKVPAYRCRSGYDQALVTLTDSASGKRRDYWLGPHGSRESRERYHRLIADWEAAGRRLPAGESGATNEGVEQGPTVKQIVREYWLHAKGEYTWSAALCIRSTLRVLRELHGQTPVSAFGPNALRQVRDAMVLGNESTGRSPWCRKTVNSRVGHVVRMFRWAASRELVRADVYHALRTLPSLRRGRTPAVDHAPIGPVHTALVDPIKPFVSRQVAALIDLQRLTGARPGELIDLRAIDIDTRHDPWRAELRAHKTAHIGKSRTVHFGPRAQEVLAPFMASRPVDAPLFSPKDAERERYAACGTHRKAPADPATTDRTLGEAYTVASYRRAIQRACDLAFPVPEGADAKAWRKAHRWHPNQLRHTAATEIRRQFGLEAAQLVLGHSSAAITDAVYAERDAAKVADVLRRVG
ncbi:MAG: site-specific integrase [Phycisphaeraceae bacterium]|nr:site-specific integrase [Phycisphaeraceae bacterium]